MPDRVRRLRLRGREYPVVLPSLSDPRLHLAAVITTLQVLGQTVLGFEVSIAQILVSIGTCAVLEVVITFWRRRMLVWPASAMLTGNGVAFILRVNGTPHGAWWCLHGAAIFATTAALSLGSKYLIRVNDRHVFNPSNLGLVVCFLLLGSTRVNPQDLWWGPMSAGLAATFAVIGVGGLIIVLRLRMLGLVVAFYASFAASLAVVAGAGHCMTARWRVGPICGQSYWWVVAASPELLVFTFFMITDPKTSPAGRVARVLFGAGVGFMAAALAAPARSEFGTKVAVLGALVVVCAAVPWLTRFLPAEDSEPDRVWPWLAARPAAASISTAAFAVAVLLGAGLAGRGVAPLAGEVFAPTGLAAPPSIEVPAGTVPRVTVEPAVRPADPTMTDDRAQQMGHDLAAHLLSEAAGVSYRFEAMKVVLIRDPTNPQSSPRLGLDARGTTDPGGPFHRAFEMTPSGDRFLVVAERPPPS